MFFSDLSKYKYVHLNENIKVINIGWLQKGNVFLTGETPIQFRQKLVMLLDRCCVNQMRGTHYCDFCSNRYEDIRITDQNGRRCLLGSAELWVPSPDESQIYAAPNLIIHYIQAHNYLPPLEFISAVEAFDLSCNWDAGEIFNQLFSSY
jgi:hypothetical protein